MSAAFVVLPVVWAHEQMHVSDRKGPCRIVAAGRGTAPVVEIPVEVAFYRKYTEGLLRRYVKLSTEAGRTPSLLGRELFRGRVSSYRVRSFDDVVIFVHDVEKCLADLDSGQMHLVRRIAMQEYTQGEVAHHSGVSLRTIHTRYGRALDKLTRIFLDRGLLEPMISSL